MKGVILYGPPAAGKDTITQALIKADSRFEMFARLKVGAGKTSTYRMTTSEHLAELRAQGAIAWENSRYGATYAVDTPALLAALKRGTPVLHLGQSEAVRAVRNATPGASWVVVYLYCPRPVAEERLRARNPADLEDRLRVWDETPALQSPDLTINTDVIASPFVAARTILRIVGSMNMVPVRDQWPPRIIVPVLTLKNRDGRLDIAANLAYAERASATWIQGFIIAGTIGAGDLESFEMRERILDIWLEKISPERLYGTAWGLSDCAWIGDRGASVLVVMRDLQGIPEALNFLKAIPRDYYIYSHPIYTPTTFTLDISARAIDAGVLPAGGKFCKISLANVASIRQVVGPSFNLYDGRCRHVARSIAAGATGVIAAPLAPLPELPTHAEGMAKLQELINVGQARMDADPERRSRLARLSAECRANLYGRPTLELPTLPWSRTRLGE